MTDPARCIRASNDTALGDEPNVVDEGSSGFSTPAVCLLWHLLDCDQRHIAGFAFQRRTEVDSWEGCSGRPIMMDTNRIDDLTPEEPKLFYLVLSNACYIPATFCISAARFAAVPVDCGTPEHATAIPLNSVAAAAAGAAAWRSDQQVLYNADRQAQRAVVLSGNCGGFSPKTTRVDSGSILSSPILPPVGIFKVFNRSSRDMSMNWRVFELDAWDKQSREHARAPPEATEPGIATRAAEQTAAAEAAPGMELCPELQTQQGTEPATGVAAPTAESCRIPRGGPAQQKSNSEAVSFDIATAAYPGATLGGADGGRANSPPSGDQAGWQFSASVEGDHARQGKEAIGQQGGDAAADTGNSRGHW
ncbi:hypothetical protein TGRH88_085790 [Toxoplasma gondii]|uniref:Uncharacterized protein n=2 Tax=Toxoplasma gondii TaxID=5811 RepID=A0A7J6KH63_TOXGO|nr:hypothetical protein TGRH88_085790 [Toxoplasma gondii]